MPEVRRPPPPMYDGVSLRGGGLSRSQRSYLSALVSGGGDSLAPLSDDFRGTALSPSWSVFNANLVASRRPANGSLDLRVTQGGTSGSFWFNAFSGILLYKIVSGACDMRARVRVRDTANSGNPPTSDSRIAGIAVHDPARPPSPNATYNYVHLGLGSVNSGPTNMIEWKTTDASASTYASSEWPVGGGLLDADLRIVRRRDDLQVFETYARASGPALGDGNGWVLQQAIGRENAALPARATAQPMPDELQWGIMLYSSEIVHDIRIFVSEVLFSRPR